MKTKGRPKSKNIEDRRMETKSRAKGSKYRSKNVKAAKDKLKDKLYKQSAAKSVSKVRGPENRTNKDTVYARMGITPKFMRAKNGTEIMSYKGQMMTTFKGGK